MRTDHEAPPENQIADIVDTINDIRDEDETSVGSIIEHLGVASFTPALLFVSIVIVTPLSGVPGLSSICGVVDCLGVRTASVGSQKTLVARFHHAPRHTWSQT